MRIGSFTSGADRPDPQAASAVGFEGLLLSGTEAEAEMGRLPPQYGEEVRSSGLKLLIDVELDSFPIEHPLVAGNPEAFTLRRQQGQGPVDPRNPAPAMGKARARLMDPDAAGVVSAAVEERLRGLVAAGAGGFRLLRPDAAPPQLIEKLFSTLRKEAGDLLFLAHAPGAARAAVAALPGLDGIVSSFAFWDFASSWLWEEHEALRLAAPLVAEVSPSAAEGARSDAALERLLFAAAALSHGFISPAALLRRKKLVKRAVELSRASHGFSGELRLFFVSSAVTAAIRADGPDIRTASGGLLVLVNRNQEAPAALDQASILPALGAEFQAFRPLRGSGAPFAPLGPAEVRVLSAHRAKPVAAKVVGGARAARQAAANPRLVIERVTPEVDGGCFPAKRIVGDTVAVEAVLFGDGHEQLAAELRWRAADEKEWRRVRMEECGNDRWTAQFALERLGRHEFAVEGWMDLYGGFRRDFRKKLDAGVAQAVDRREGRNFVDKAQRRSRGELGRRLAEFVRRINAADEAEAAAILLDPELALLMDEADERLFSILSTPRPIDAERLAARFSSWYELFPRSQTDDPDRHGTFEDVIARLPQIREMGFDTLYFPPIHPIGRKHRKGRNNTLTPAPGDPGSPYAIGAEEGGHDAVHPELGTLEDFRRLIDAARRHGLEIALDFAIQCSPDHPWLKEHPGWFDWRPDGTVKYAENPPKKYQDIVNVDFYKDEAIPGLWIALRDVVLFWIEQGVKTFRVDNPHTKPFAFWEWMIGDIRAVHPDAIFLAEAFTRPKVMYRLAKVGFSQSYTYFTWRNGKAELTDYLTELTTTAPMDFFRPHFFVNTPDINPPFLQTSGRGGFKIRAALAATLSGLFGVYSGFELCEADAVPGKEEYWESEKYEVKPRDWNAPGNIVSDIILLNRLRRAYPALQTHLGVRFYNAFNDNILYYGKPSPDGGEMILVAVSLDPHNAQEADFEIPLWEWKLADHDSLEVDDLVGGNRFRWHGKVQHVRLDPDQPYAIWKVSPAGDAA